MSNSHLIILHLLDVIACLRSESRRGIILTAQNEMQNKMEIRVTLTTFGHSLGIKKYIYMEYSDNGGDRRNENDLHIPFYFYSFIPFKVYSSRNAKKIFLWIIWLKQKRHKNELHFIIQHQRAWQQRLLPLQRRPHRKVPSRYSWDIRPPSHLPEPCRILKESNTYSFLFYSSYQSN